MDNNQGEVVLVKDINPGIDRYDRLNGSFPSYFIEFNDKLYFSARNSENGGELWVTDGTAEGTQLAVDIDPSNDSYNGSYPEDLTEFNDKLYFSASGDTNSRELWVSDGTAEGTQLAVDINPSGYSIVSFQNSGFTEFNDRLYFTADDVENGRELWKTDGTAEGTQQLLDINPGDVYAGYFISGPYSGSNPNDFTEFDGKLYFSAFEPETGRELWKTDGTAEGTQQLVDINPGFYSGSDPVDFTEFNGRLYFGANDGENGQELWKTDGTLEGTQLVVDINSSVNNYGEGYSSYPNSFTEFNDRLYFSASVGETGREIWKTDGTAEGTQLVADINPGRSSSLVSFNRTNFTEFNGKLYFSADNGETGNELWVTDGTAEGTQLFADINPGSESSYPSDFTEFNGELYFSADNGDTGDELYKLTFDGSVEPTEPYLIKGTITADIIEGTEEGDRIKGFAGNDVIRAQSGNDTVFGDAGNDELFGDAGNDFLSGGTGNDTINGGAGNDTLTGSDGRDLFFIGTDNGEDRITDFNPEQDSFGLLNDLSFEDLTLTGGRIQVEDSVLATVAGIDTSSLSASNFSQQQPSQPSEPTEPNDSDLIRGTITADNIEGTEESDRIKGFAANDVINAQSGNDTVFGDLGNDELFGGVGNDFISGGLGNDTIDGGAGNDVLVGAEGNDFFVLNTNEDEDTITDFDLASDRLILGGGLAFEELSFNENSILVGEETLATLDDIDTTQLQPDNFV